MKDIINEVVARFANRNPAVRHPKEVMIAITNALHAHPELRIGQLLVNSIPKDRDLFYIEDAELAEMINSFSEAGTLKKLYHRDRNKVQ